jgi:Cu(I)/Ag(I) efflux system membrane protein CusA/SilA
VIEVAIGGKPLTTTVEGRERYPVRVRYQRELRNNLEELGRILVPGPGGTQIQFKRVSTTLLVFSGIFVAWAGGFLMLWLYGQDWFLDVSLFGAGMRDLFQVRAFNLSVAVCVGFLALFGITSDNGVVLSTYLDQRFDAEKPATREAVREATVVASLRGIRPALMTSATTILALIPVLTSTGRGSGIMVPMALPSFGGITVFLVPVLYCGWAEMRVKRTQKKN